MINSGCQMCGSCFFFDSLQINRFLFFSQWKNSVSSVINLLALSLFFHLRFDIFILERIQSNKQQSHLFFIQSKIKNKSQKFLYFWKWYLIGPLLALIRLPIVLVLFLWLIVVDELLHLIVCLLESEFSNFIQ
jgi:hypothetical protein